MESVKIDTEDGFILDADYYPGTGSLGVIYTHGATSHRGRERFFERAARELSSKGVHCLFFDFRGHGKSGGDSAKDFKLSGVLKDLAAAVDFLKSKGMKTLGLAGASFGASVSSIYASKNNGTVGALMLVNPVLNFHTAFFEPTTENSRMLFSAVHKTLETEEYFEMPWNNFRLGRPAFEELRMKLPEHDPILSLDSYKGPLLIVHGNKDRTIDHNETLDYFNRIKSNNKRFITINGADHSFLGEPGQTEVTDIAIKFFSDNLS
ncbi:MAG: alpha/beta fold hydrolase [Candidatus Vogelbacteria bacterium]|nr:alpha/beta fold hydrolase [Candidatus Vogelbacteria bacterium]